MTLSSDEQPTTADEALHDSLIGFTGCIGNSLVGICSYGLTIGDSYVPFDPDPDDECEDDEVACSQAWVRVAQINPKPSNSEPSWDGECALVLQADLEVGVLRCFPVYGEGEAPSASDVLTAAIQAMQDMASIHRAAMACEVWDSITTGSWQPFGPMGGQYGGTWTFTVELGGGCLVSESV